MNNDSNDEKMAKRVKTNKRILKWLGIAVAAFVVFAVIGTVFGDEESDDKADEPSKSQTKKADKPKAEKKSKADDTKDDDAKAEPAKNDEKSDDDSDDGFDRDEDGYRQSLDLIQDEDDNAEDIKFAEEDEEMFIVLGDEVCEKVWGKSGDAAKERAAQKMADEWGYSVLQIANVAAAASGTLCPEEDW